MYIVSIEDEIVAVTKGKLFGSTACHLTGFHTYRNTWTARGTRKTLKVIRIKVNWIKICYLMIHLD